MKSLFVLFLFSLSPFSSAIDTGNGSDGACTETSFVVGKRLYQCTSLHISGNVSIFKGSGGSSVLIKVQNDASIGAGVTVDFSANAGTDGLANSTVSGGAAGAGGSAGGNSQLSLAGLSGGGTGAGVGGKYVANLGVRSYGGGGGGGSYKTTSATTASDGDDGGGSGTVPNTLGANGTTYGSEASFETTFDGGSGGGAGGADQDGATNMSGSSGGGGGGALHIVAGGNILVDGTIKANGGNGGGSGVGLLTSAGGAGSGGAIWLQAAGTLTVSVTGVISSQGGTGGSNDSGVSGLGGNGGNGRIRLDDADGIITNNGSVTPAAYSTSFTPTTATSGSGAISSRQYSSSISCARVSEEFNHNHLINLIFGFCLAGAFYLFSSRKKV